MPAGGYDIYAVVVVNRDDGPAVVSTGGPRSLEIGCTEPVIDGSRPLAVARLPCNGSQAVMVTQNRAATAPLLCVAGAAADRDAVSARRC